MPEGVVDRERVKVGELLGLALGLLGALPEAPAQPLPVGLWLGVTEEEVVEVGVAPPWGLLLTPPLLGEAAREPVAPALPLAPLALPWRVGLAEPVGQGLGE